MAGAWTIEVGGVARKYKNIKFERKLDRKSPTKFSATVEYASNISYFDLVKIKRDGTVEWKGFVEEIDIDWDKEGRYLYISGRDTTIILWKKYIENFSSMHKDTGGFFGRINANELIKFLLRTPKSDPISDYIKNKSGWGIAVGRMGELVSSRTGFGHPNWTKLRRRGYGWRNSGESEGTQKNVDSFDSTNSSNWTETGASPYLDAKDDDNYVKSGSVTGNDAVEIFGFSNLAANASCIEKVVLSVVWRPDTTYWSWINSHCDIYIWIESDSAWRYVGEFGGRKAPWKPNPWLTYSWDISDKFNSVDDVNKAKVKFMNMSSSLSTNITHAYLGVTYTAAGTQETYDLFDIPFEDETIMGIYIESRMDDESYPRHYKIVTVTNDKENLAAYSEEDPNSHITVVGTDHIDFDAYQNEDAYLYKDTADYFGTYLKHTFDVKVVTDPVENDTRLGVWVLSNYLDDLYGLDTGSKDYVALLIVSGIGTGPYFQLRERDGADVQMTGDTTELTEGTTYSIEIERVGTKLTATIFTDSTLFVELSLTLTGGNKYRYCMPAVTYNGLASEDVDTNLIVNNFYVVHQDFTHEGAVPWLNDGDTNYIWINNQVGSEGSYDEYYDFYESDIHTKYSSIDVDVATLTLRCKMSLDTTSCTIRPYLKVEASGSWISCPAIGVGTTSYSDYEVTPPAGTLDTLAKIKYARLKIVYETHGAGAGVVSISKAWLHIEGTGYWTPDWHTDVDIDDLIIEKESAPLVSVSPNTYRDIIHSWTPQSMNHLRVRITTADSNHSWGISQVYIYKAEDVDYRVYKETGSPSFPDDQYILAISEDNQYSSPIGPLNVGIARLQDAINTVIKYAHESYIPYVWWLAMDDNNTFHIADRKGSDKHATVTFNKGIQLGGVDKSQDVSDTVQRLKVMGRGEDKRQEEISSDWKEDTTAMNAVGTFIEDIIVERSLANKDVADTIALINLESEKDAKVQVKVYVSNDNYSSMACDVGDEVQIVDSLTATNDSLRIYNIIKSIEENGEHVTLVLGTPWKQIDDEWHEIYKRLKDLDLVGVYTADWMGEYDQASKVDVKESVTDFFEKTAMNDEETSAKEIKDPSWYVVPSPDNYTAPTGSLGDRSPERYDFGNGRRWERDDKKMILWGPTSGGGTQTLLVELRGPTNETTDITMSKNPKLVMELKAYEKTGESPHLWKDNDYFNVGLVNGETNKGYFFKIKKESGVFYAYGCWCETGDLANDTVEEKIRTLTVNTKYRFEILTEADNQLVIFNIYDLDREQKYPPSVVVMGIDTSIVVRPLYMYLSSQQASEKRAVVYIYRFRTEWEKVT